MCSPGLVFDLYIDFMNKILQLLTAESLYRTLYISSLHKNTVKYVIIQSTFSRPNKSG